MSKEDGITVENRNFQYIIMFPSYGFPVDELVLARAMLSKEYKFAQSPTSIKYVAIKQTSTITIDIRGAQITVVSTKIDELSSIISEIYAILEKDCAVDMARYVESYFFSVAYHVSVPYSPRESLTRAFYGNNKGTEISKIFDTNFMCESIELVSGDRWVGDYINLKIEPRLTRPTLAFFVTLTARNHDRKAVDSLIENSEDKIVRILKVMGKSA